MASVTHPEPAFWFARPNLPVLEIVVLLGYCIVIIDMEHGAITQEACDALVAQGRVLGLTVIVRLAEARRILVQQALDYGAVSVMLPMIRDAAHAAEASGFAKYPPQGTRGVGLGHAFTYGNYHSVDEDLHRSANTNTRCHVMIEMASALDDIDAIAALASVDGRFIGPSDLSLARGRGAFRFTAEDEADFRRVAKACRRHNKLVGLPAANPGAFALAQADGLAYVTLLDDLTALHAGLAHGLATLCQRERQA
ncbi:MAG: HpcH/HpaI aldolase family protein [Dongiaceae bacterium]